MVNAQADALTGADTKGRIKWVGESHGPKTEMVRECLIPKCRMRGIRPAKPEISTGHHFTKAALPEFT